MKKSLILVGLLSIGYAHAQYDGKVGVNTETPSATLNVKSLIGTSKYTKNFELENGAGRKLVTVLDDGSFGIGVENPKEEVNINNRFRISYNGSPRGIGIVASTSAWARGYHFTTIDGATKFGGFAAYGGNDTLDYFFIGDHYSSPIVNFVASSKNIGMGTTNPTNKLHIKADAGKDPLKLEGLQAGSSTDKVVVVDASGVLKTVDRASIGGGTQGITTEVDGIVGNEVKDATQNGGLVRSGNGDAASPYTLGIKDGGVTGTMLAANSVEGSKIAPNAVDSSKLANGSVTSDKLNIPGTNKGDVLVWNGSSWVSQAPQSGASLDAITGAVKVVTAITKATWAEKVDGKGIFALSQTGDAAIQLPNPADYKFRIIAVNNQYTNQLNYASEYSPTYSVLDSGKGHLLISDGQKWMIIGGSF